MSRWIAGLIAAMVLVLGAGLIAAMVLVVSGGSGESTQLHRGVVVDRDHDAGELLTIPCGKVICLIPEDDEWWVQVEGTVGGKVVREWHDVDAETYDRLEVGAEWSEERDG